MENPEVVFSFLEDGEGYSLDVFVEGQDEVQFATKWLPASFFEWAASDGQTVQYYNGPHGFVMGSVTDIL